MDLEITIQHRPHKRDVELLRQFLVDHNTSHSKIEEGQDLGIFLRTPERELVGGVYGWMWGECLEVHYLWVRPDVRGKGYGKRLMALIEEQAAQKGCTQAVLETFSFQAPEFYAKRGYEIWGSLEGYPDQCRKYFLKKRLSRWL